MFKERGEVVEAYSEYEKAIQKAGVPAVRSWVDGGYEYDYLTGGIDVRDVEFDLAKVVSTFESRKRLIKKYGFAIPNLEALEYIKKYSPLLEVGSGTGYWSHELKKLNVDIIATDLGMWQKESQWQWEKSWVEVEQIDGVEAVRKYPDRTLLMIWPSYNNIWAYKTLKEYQGKYFIYIGEYSGCCAEENFFGLLDEEWEEIEAIRIPVWYGVHDRLLVYARG